MKRLLLLIFLIPITVMAQTNGTYKFDFAKKKHKQQDSTTAPIEYENDDETQPAPKKEKKPVVHRIDNDRNYDFKNEGVFKGTFNAGLNACQIDGDNEYGYKYFGAEFGAGVLARVHKFLSVSMELDYSMKGAKSRLQSTADMNEFYQVQWDYVQAPIAFNGHYKDKLIVGVGLSPAYMVRYKEINYSGINVTADPPLGQPNKFDLEIFAQIHYVFKKHYAIGFKYSYSLLKIREPISYTRVNGQYNNVLNLRFMYILGPVRKKGK